MSLILALVSQKGGVGKSTLAFSAAREYAQHDWNVLIADMDPKQGTTTEWNSIRLANNIEPYVSVQQFPSVQHVLKQRDHYDLIIFDGAPHATKQTLEICKVSDFIVLPTNLSKSDQNPQIRLAHEIVKNGISQKKFAFAFYLTGSSDSRLAQSHDYIDNTGYEILKGAIAKKDAYEAAIDDGKTVTETPFKSLNEKADILLQSIMNKLQ